MVTLRGIHYEGAGGLVSLETPHGDRPAPKEPAENSGWGPGGDSGSLGLERGAAPTPRGPSCPGPGSKPPGKARVWGTVPPSGRGEADVRGREGRFRGHLSRGAQQDTSPAQATWRACGLPGRLLGRPRGQRPGDRPRAEETKHVGARREVKAAWSPLHPAPRDRDAREHSLGTDRRPRWTSGRHSPGAKARASRT